LWRAQPIETHPRDIGPFEKALCRVLEADRDGPLSRALGLRDLRACYRRALALDPARPFPARALEALGVDLRVDARELTRVPREGPVLVVANHPTGFLDGLVLLEVLGRVRPDARVLANAALRAFAPLRDRLIAVDPYGGDGAARANLRPLRECLRRLRGGGVVAAFPAGDVASFRPRRAAVREGPWDPRIARIARSAGASVVPVHLEGANGWAFHLLGLIHPRLRTVLMPRTMLARRGRTVRVRVGSVVAARDLARFEDDEALASTLRMRTLLLRAPRRTPVARGTQELEPIARPSPAARLRGEIEDLPRSQVLVEAGDFEVFHFRAPQAPTVLREIGRLREITFRAVDEGTGRSLDLSRFDDDYIHLVIRDRGENRIAGAYRLGPTDEILPRRGPAGLYTTTLFRMSPRVLARIDPALEMGRSFVRAEYQKSYQPLMLLWKGIGRFVVERPRYNRLFGPVSINCRYRSLSTRLIMEFLRQNGHWSDLAGFVRPRRPPRRPARRERQELRAFGSGIRDVEQLGALVAELEADGKGIPILLKQYLKLGAELLGFNVDPDFGDALDGLVLTDLANTSPRLLRKYMGVEGMTGFLAHHGRRPDGAPVSPARVA
jgi:putative hemolysin